MSSIGIVGGSLVGASAAARLARAGHDVTVYEREPRLGGRWAEPAAWELPGGAAVVLPAAWRDLFAKSGQPLKGALGRAGLELVPAPDPVHLLADGTRLVLPTDRAAAWHALSAQLGEPAAAAWRDLVDHLDRLWQVLRPLGLEADEPLTRAAWRALEPDVCLADLARRLPPPLAEVLLAAAAGQDPSRVPGWAATTFSVERLFGRWQLVDGDGATVSPAALVDVLAGRLAERGVAVALGTPVTGRTATTVQAATGTARHDLVIDTTSPWSGLQRAPWRLHPATGADGRPDPSLGARFDGAASWRRRPPLTGSDGIVRASVASRAGAAPWAQLLTGALATYVAHERLTGTSIRPADDPRRE